MEKTLYTKGYLVRCTSWENDGDNYKTKEKQLPTLEYTVIVREALKMCENCYHDSVFGLGNLMEYTPRETNAIIEFIQKHKEVLDKIYNFSGEDEVEIFETLVSDYLGYSEYYIYRVCSSVEIYHFKEDVIVEII